MDAARALAEMAIEVEEGAGKGASHKAIAHKARARMKRLGMEPIHAAGDTVPFDREKHELLGSAVAPGTPVKVVRPGYIWQDAVIERPVVQEQ